MIPPCLIVDAGMASALLTGRKTQVHVSLASRLAGCVAGDRIRIREACLAARHEAGQDIVTTPQRAEFAIFRDGWRQYRNGDGKPGRAPGNTDYTWIAARHMPDWASRMTLIVEAARRERLRAITRRDIRAEGALPLLGGLLWRWPRPLPRTYVTARAAFAANWNVNHPTPGQRWQDDPPVVVLDIRLAAGSP